MLFRGEYAFLSNFYKCDILYNGILYPSAEHAFQAAKCIDDNMKKYIASQETPALAKREGRKVKMRPDWHSVKIDVMREILKIKFSDPTLRKMINDTGEIMLVEDNSWGDEFWGVYCGKGKNWLGKVLMEIRASKVN